VEAPARSGSLITARLANELGREVFAIPGRIDQRNAEGCNRFISEGQAKLVQSFDDILDELRPVADALRGEPARAAQTRLVEPDAPARTAAAADAVGTDDGGQEEEELPAAPDAAPDDREGRVLAVLGDEEVHIDEICARSGLPVHEVSATLMLLELKRRIQQQPGRFFVRTAH
jgi:DNA processing protein